MLAKKKILHKEFHPHEVSKEITRQFSNYIFINGKAYTKADEPVYSVSYSSLVTPERHADMELSTISTGGKIASEGYSRKKFFRADQFEEAKKYCIDNNTGKYTLTDSMIERIDQQKITVLRPETLKYGQVRRFATEIKLEITISIETEGISLHTAMEKAIAKAEEQFFPMQCNGYMGIHKEKTHILPDHADITPLHLKTAKGQSTLHYKPSKNEWHCEWKSKDKESIESQEIPITNWSREYRLSLLYLYTLYKIAFPDDWYVSTFSDLSEEKILELGKLPLHQLIQNWASGNITPETSPELAQVVRYLTKGN